MVGESVIWSFAESGSVSTFEMRGKLVEYNDIDVYRVLRKSCNPWISFQKLYVRNWKFKQLHGLIKTSFVKFLWLAYSPVGSGALVPFFKKYEPRVINFWKGLYQDYFGASLNFLAFANNCIKVLVI